MEIRHRSCHFLVLGMDDEGLIFIVTRIDHSGGGIFKEIL